MSIFEYENSGAFLTHTFKEIVKKNPSYSLRSFSKKVGVSPAHMSRVLKGTKRLSPAMADQVAMRLRLPATSAEYFNLLVKYENAKNTAHRDELIKKMALKKKRDLHKILPEDVFKIISDWYHPAILVLLKIKDFKNDVAWIANRLGISQIRTSEALKRLHSTGLVAYTADGQLVPSDNADLSTTDNILSSAIRTNHLQQIDLAKQALKEQPKNIREFNNVTLCMNTKNVEKAKMLIREFTERFATELDQDGGDELFQINVQFFQLSK